VIEADSSPASVPFTTLTANIAFFSHLLIFICQVLQFGIRQVLNVDHLVVRLVDGLDDLVQFQVDRPGIAVLRILDQENDEKRYHRRARIDDQLPRVRITKIRSGCEPSDNCEQSDEERPFRSDPVGSLGCENMKSLFCAVVSHPVTIGEF
jgi:hypothetical protein